MRRFWRSSARVLGSPDGRWSIAATAITASVATTVTWLAMAAQPSPAGVYEPLQVQAGFPYDLLSRLAQTTTISVGTAESPAYRPAGLIAPGLTAPFDAPVAKPAEPTIEKKTLKIERGDTIIGVLEEAGVSAEDATAVVDAMRPHYSPRNIKSGQTFEATFGPETTTDKIADAAQPDEADASSSFSRRLLSLTFSPSIENQITVRLTAPDSYLAEMVQRKFQERYQRAAAEIDSSLYLAAVQAGIPANLIVELIRIFSYDVDFQRDVHPGDGFEVVFNRFYTQEGQPAKTGEILSAAMTLSGKKHTLYRYETGGDEEYFDANGQSAKSMLMKTPVDGARISSRFGRRFHPVLGYNRMHKGIDFAVPKGTPVMAAGNGTVAYAGPANGYGNLVVINHANGYSTAYGHLSRFAVRTGSRIRQGQIVAYSGATGIATGPHLHYEIRVNNAQVNPASVKMASGHNLVGDERKGFLAERGRIDAMVASLPIQTKLAQAIDLREATSQ